MTILEKIKDAVRRRPERVTREEYLKKLISKGLNPDGSPVLDPTPMAPPIGYKKHPSMVDIVRDMVRSERLKHDLEAAGHESFEESQDFDIGDDHPQLRSEHEYPDDSPTLKDLLAAGADAKAAREKSNLPDPHKPADRSGDGGGPINKPDPSPPPPAPKAD